MQVLRARLRVQARLVYTRRLLPTSRAHPDAVRRRPGVADDQAGGCVRRVPGVLTRPAVEKERGVEEVTILKKDEAKREDNAGGKKGCMQG